MAEVLSQPVVIDNGTGIIKAGFAGADKPKVGLGCGQRSVTSDDFKRLCTFDTNQEHKRDLFAPRWIVGEA